MSIVRLIHIEDARGYWRVASIDGVDRDVSWNDRLGGYELHGQVWRGQVFREAGRIDAMELPVFRSDAACIGPGADYNPAFDRIYKPEGWYSPLQSVAPLPILSGDRPEIPDREPDVIQ